MSRDTFNLHTGCNYKLIDLGPIRGFEIIDEKYIFQLEQCSLVWSIYPFRDDYFEQWIIGNSLFLVSMYQGYKGNTIYLEFINPNTCRIHNWALYRIEHSILEKIDLTCIKPAKKLYIS